MPAARRSITSTLFLLIAAVLLPAASQAQAEEMLTPHKARYDVRISVLSGSLVSEVTLVEPGYMANTVISPTGLSRMIARGAIQESSYFLADPGGVRPAQYRSIDTLSSENEKVTLDFDWREQKVEGVINDRQFNAELDGRVHDRLSIQYELMLDLLNGTAADQYWMLDGDELKLLNVTNIGTRTLEVPFGTFKAVGIQHSKENSTRVTTLWCAEELDYLPVVIEQHRKGKLGVRAVLTSYEPVPKAVAARDRP